MDWSKNSNDGETTMNRSEIKAQRKELLIQELSKTAMKTKEIAQFLNITDGTAWEYVSEMRYKGLLYVAFYERTQGGPVAKYMSGDLDDAEYPEIVDIRVLRTRKYRATKKDKKILYVKPKARCDIAAAWMRNPIC